MKYEIEIEGLPEGWRAVVFRKPVKGERYFYQGSIWTAHIDGSHPDLIVEKIKPRRIVLEETRMVRVANPGEWYEYGDGGVVSFRDINNTPTLDKFRIWREVKEEETK